MLRQSLHLIAKFPMLAVYAYQAYLDEFHGKSLVIHRPEPEYSTAENFLHMLRPDSKFTELEALVLDMTLVLHAEHGGGNNSSFTTHVVSSTGTDTYSAIAASLGSLKGPRHGGANLKVVGMFDDLREPASPTGRTTSRSRTTCTALLNKEAFDRAGLVYGMGHPVYSVSDPRAIILRGYAEKLADEKGYSEEFALHKRVERIAPLVIAAQRRRLQGRERQRRLLLRLRLPHARHPRRALHAALRDLARRGLERAPARGARQRRQDHPPGVQERLAAAGRTCRSETARP